MCLCICVYVYYVLCNYVYLLCNSYVTVNSHIKFTNGSAFLNIYSSFSFDRQLTNESNFLKCKMETFANVHYRGPLFTSVLIIPFVKTCRDTDLLVKEKLIELKDYC